jgi:light-regulated signal transduction histidine kinase (bacteriophytochrome)
MDATRILIVDDSRMIVKQLTEQIQEMGWEVAGTASSGQEAIDMTEKTQPHLILMDIILNGEMDGIEAATEIRRRWSLPIIYLTSYTNKSILKRASATDPCAYIVKPCSKGELHANIEMALYKHKAQAKLKQMEEIRIQLLQALEKANKGLERLKTFNYLASHDLRSPLRIVNEITKVLEGYTLQLPTEAQKYIRMLKESVQQMDLLIQDLLSLARVDNQPLQKQPIALADLIGTVLKNLRTEQEGRCVEIKMGALPTCQANPILLEHVLMNLLSNALKYTRIRKSALIEIGCRKASTEEDTIFFIKDNGIGFDSQYVHKIFNIFERLHTTSEYEGTGLGLAIVQRAIEQHGGQVWAEAVVDSGATFFFTLGNQTSLKTNVTSASTC